MLVTVRQLLEHAARQHYTIGAFNTVNLEMTLGIIRAAVDTQSPVIIQVTEHTINYAGLKPITHIVETIAKNSAVNVPVALHFDHGRSFRSVAECINAGFSSIMIDASDLPYDENVILTRQAVDYAHKRNVIAQGEVGQLKRAEVYATDDDREKSHTDPEQAEAFVKATNVDTLAVAVGNVYGIYKLQHGTPPLDIERLAAIHERIPQIPLVLHGASGISPEQIHAATERGIRVINIITEIEYAFTEALRTSMQQQPDVFDPRVLLEPAVAAVQKVVTEKLTLFNSVNQAKTFPRL